MTQLTINIENTSILPHLRKILNAIDGVSIAKPINKRKSGIEEAYEDVRSGRVTRYNNTEDLYKAMGI